MVAMNKLIALTITAITAAAALAPSAGAQTNPTDPIKVEKAYLSLTHYGKQEYVRLVFKTADPLARRYDGLIRAGASIEGVGHSLGTAKRGTTWYSTLSRVKGNSIATSDGTGSVGRKGVKVGRTYTVKIFNRDGSSTTTKRLKLLAKQPKLN
jgi:hypothetical protein